MLPCSVSKRNSVKGHLALQMSAPLTCDYFCFDAPARTWKGGAQGVDLYLLSSPDSVLLQLHLQWIVRWRAGWRYHTNTPPCPKDNSRINQILYFQGSFPLYLDLSVYDTSLRISSMCNWTIVLTNQTVWNNGNKETRKSNPRSQTFSKGEHVNHPPNNNVLNKSLHPQNVE